MDSVQRASPLSLKAFRLRELVEFYGLSSAAKTQDIHRAGINTSRAPDTLHVVHRPTLTSIPHNIYSHMTGSGTEVTTDALLLFSKDSVCRELGIDMHEGCQWTAVSAPDAARVEEVCA